MSLDLINEFGETLTVTRYGQSIQTVVMTFDADLILGNKINLDIDLFAITQVPFNTDHDTTMLDLATEIESSAKVSTATVSGAREITITAADEGSDLLISGIVVAGGLSQAVGSTVQSGGYIDGVYQPGLSSTFDIVMSVQPLKGNELQIIPEGERTRRFVKGYTATRLYTADEALSKMADLVGYDSTVFEVHAVERWVDGDLHHYKVMMAEVN